MQHLWHWVVPGNIHNMRTNNIYNIILMMVAGFDVENKIKRAGKKVKIRAIIIVM